MSEKKTLSTRYRITKKRLVPLMTKRKRNPQTLEYKSLIQSLIKTWSTTVAMSLKTQNRRSQMEKNSRILMRVEKKMGLQKKK